MAMTAVARHQVCETWQDHDWSEPRFRDVVQHRTLGPMQRLVSRCTRCGHTRTETRFMHPVTEKALVKD